MKKTYTLVLIILFMTLFSCQDEFCLDATTPSLIIRFYDKDNVTNTKSLNVIVWANDMDSLYNGTATDSLAIPLDTDNNNVIYHFSILEEGDEETDEEVDNGETDEDVESDDEIVNTQEDIIITYTTEDIYVSKACGFKSIFNDLNINATNNNWLDSYNIISTEITDEKNAHIHIFH